MKPYIDEKLSENEWIRTFDLNANSDEYVWHRDVEDREFEVLEGTGWKFQFDNQLPYVINKGSIVQIKSMSYHRLIKGQDNLKIRIKENV